jgi:hypothetical protein
MWLAVTGVYLLVCYATIGIGLWYILSAIALVGVHPSDRTRTAEGHIRIVWKPVAGDRERETIWPMDPVADEGVGDPFVWYHPDRPDEVVMVSPVCHWLTFGTVLVMAGLPLLSGYCVAIARS